MVPHLSNSLIGPLPPVCRPACEASDFSTIERLWDDRNAMTPESLGPGASKVGTGKFRWGNKDQFAIYVVKACRADTSGEIRSLAVGGACGRGGNALVAVSASACLR